MKNLKVTFLYKFLFFDIFVQAQNYETDKIYITIKDKNKLQLFLNYNKDSLNNNQVSSILSSSNFISIEKVILDKTGIEKLDNWYLIKFSGNANSFIKRLGELGDTSFSDIELVPNVFELANSNDYYEVNSNPLIENQALKLINAGQAWDIRQNNTTKIAVSGESGYQGHEDLLANVIYQENAFNSSSLAFHGTAVAGCAGAVTNNNTGIASAGYNPKILLYSSSLNLNMTKLIDAITQGAKVITISQGSLSYSSYYQTVIDYGYNQGVVFVAGAGNGINWENQFGGGSCDRDNFSDNLNTVGSGSCLVYPASYNHVISVTSISHSNVYGTPVYLNIPAANLNGYYNYLWKDLHEQFANDITSTHTHNSKIDICAPGYGVPSLNYDINNKYINVWGTSFAAPMVASAISLLLSINPCFTPDDIEYIIKSTANNIYALAENQKYLGKLGSGRLDLFAAANLAVTYKANFIQNLQINSTNIYKGHSIIIGNAVNSSAPYGLVTINSGSNVNFNSRQLIEIKEGFEAKENSAFEFYVNENFIPCP
jgi:hypothetical protein